MKQFVSQSAICWSWLSKLVMSTSIKTEYQSSHPLLMPTVLRHALFLLRIWNDCEEWLLWKNVRKQNFNYCNESFWRGIESVAFVWSQRELILASSTMVIRHRLNNTERGWEYDKKHGKRETASERERETRDTVKFLSKLRDVSKICCNVQITTITTDTHTIMILNNVFGSCTGCQRRSNIGSLINFLAT